LFIYITLEYENTRKREYAKIKTRIREHAKIAPENGKKKEEKMRDNDTITLSRFFLSHHTIISCSRILVILRRDNNSTRWRKQATIRMCALLVMINLLNCRYSIFWSLFFLWHWLLYLLGVFIIFINT